uniref:Protein ARV n=1 Tax=Syphacia muris TaxID=451379 RepID=A0A0N5ARG4_9BILA
MEPGRYICINCCQEMDSLYRTYAGGNIRLTQCSKCKHVVDKYVEYDIVLVVIDLILQYIGAYRHLLLNAEHVAFHKLAIIFALCDAYNKWMFRRAQVENGKMFDLEWTFYECFAQSALEMLSFFLIILALNYRQNTCTNSMQLMLTSICIGYYGNVFVVLSIIWHLHTKWSYRALTQLFILISHIQVQRSKFFY